MSQPAVSMGPAESVEVGGITGTIHVCGDDRSISIAIYEDGGHCLAMIAAEELREFRHWWITRFRVVEEHRGRGVGTFLLTRLKKELRHRPNFKKLQASVTALTAGAPMRRFYERRGFLSLVGKEDVLCIWHRPPYDPSLCVKVWASDEAEPKGEAMSNLASAPVTWFREPPVHAAELYVLERWGNEPQNERIVYVRNGRGERLAFMASSVLEVSISIKELT